ncbi:MAG: protein-export membrane protein SecD [Deltaproteobacteria bacterium RBG_13_52_11]|nr:MAG: protein-export membrane protein SecD [Deltaproteobacteria bacterium RBG_13_52_11]
MKGSLQWRFLLILFVLVGSLIFLFPTLVKEVPSWWPKFFPQDKIQLGLDLQGGMHLTFEVETDKAVESSAERLKNDLRDNLKKERIFYTSIDRVLGDVIEVVLLNPDVKQKFDDYLKDQYPTLKETSSQKEGDRVKVVLGMDPRQIEDIKKSAVDQALETIRNRVDQFGVAEPDISRQGEDRIIVQLPGVKDPERAKDLIGKTALLEFKLVDEDADLNRVLAGDVPFGDVILYQRVVDPKTGAVRKIPYVIKDRTLMTGDTLKDARVRIDQNNRSYIGISLHPAGARLFEEITGENVGRRLAIILDNNVYSAPVINTRISGGEAVIEGRFTMQEARDLAIVLRAGSLPAPVQILEERTVGPSLGKDSINKGFTATIIGGILVLLYMMIYYRFSGFVANIALIMNMVLLLAALAVLRATLTLPGIAGIALTVGMAVDANVLIYERIREEIRLGKPPRAALEAGYTRAFLTIMDSNVTTVIAALVLLQFGTGPVKGFAITLSIGIAASMFTAIVVTRFIFDFVLNNFHVKRLSV